MLIVSMKKNYSKLKLLRIVIISYLKLYYQLKNWLTWALDNLHSSWYTHQQTYYDAKCYVLVCMYVCQKI